MLLSHQIKHEPQSWPVPSLSGSRQTRLCNAGPLNGLAIAKHITYGVSKGWF